MCAGIGDYSNISFHKKYSGTGFFVGSPRTSCGEGREGEKGREEGGGEGEREEKGEGGEREIKGRGRREGEGERMWPVSL